MWDWGDGTTEIALPGEIVSHCFCETTTRVTHTLAQGNRTFTHSELIDPEPSECDPWIISDWDHEITNFIGCTDPTTCCCSNCDIVTVQFTDLSISNSTFPVAFWTWYIYVDYVIVDVVSGVQNLTYDFEDGIWNTGSTIHVALDVANGCRGDELFLLLKGNC